MRVLMLALLLCSAVSVRAINFVTAIDPDSMTAVECWNPENCTPTEAFALKDVYPFPYEFLELDWIDPAEESLPDDWFVFRYITPDDADPYTPHWVYYVSIHFEGPNFDHWFTYAFEPNVVICIAPPIPRPPVVFPALSGDGCIEPAAAEEREYSFELQNAYPNPCNGSAVIEYSLPATQQAELAVYNLRGQRMTLLASGLHEAGQHSVRVEMDNWPSGMYLCQLQAGQKMGTKRFLLVR